MLKDLDKLTLSLAFIAMSDDIEINIIRMPKLRNSCFFATKSQDGTFDRVVPIGDMGKATSIMDVNNINEFFSTVVKMYYAKLISNESPQDISIEEMAEIVFQKVVANFEDNIFDTNVHKAFIEKNELIEDVLKYVNIGSKGHQLLSSLSLMLKGIFYFVGLNQRDGQKDSLNMEDCLKECYEYATTTTTDDIRKWRNSRDSAFMDDAFDKELIKVLTLGILSKHINFKIGNDMRVENTLYAKFENALDLRAIFYIHNKNTKYNSLRQFRGDLYDSIMFKNECDDLPIESPRLQESIIISMFKRNGMCRESVEEFVKFYLVKFIDEVNFGRDMKILSTIMLNIMSFMNVAGDNDITPIDIQADHLKVKDIERVFAENYKIATQNPMLASKKAIQLNKLLSDFYK